jgi:hypothetical protein
MYDEQTPVRDEPSAYISNYRHGVGTDAFSASIETQYTV